MRERERENVAIWLKVEIEKKRKKSKNKKKEFVLREKHIKSGADFILKKKKNKKTKEKIWFYIYFCSFDFLLVLIRSKIPIGVKIVSIFVVASERVVVRPYDRLNFPSSQMMTSPIAAHVWARRLL